MGHYLRPRYGLRWVGSIFLRRDLRDRPNLSRRRERQCAVAPNEALAPPSDERAPRELRSGDTKGWPLRASAHGGRCRANTVKRPGLIGRADPALASVIGLVLSTCA